MKKIIATAMAMVSLITGGATTTNTRNFGDSVKAGVIAQCQVRETKYSNNFGLPMKETTIVLFGSEFYKYNDLDLEISYGAHTGSELFAGIINFL